MKRNISLLLLFALIATPAVVIAFGLNEKLLKVELTQKMWTRHLDGLNYVSNAVMESDLPAVQRKF